MNGNQNPGTPGKESSDDTPPIGAAIETLTVRELTAEVEGSGERVKLILRNESSDGRTSASLWFPPERARELAAEILQNAEVAEQYLAEIEEEADTERGEA
jgi:hypothetical protein